MSRTTYTYTVANNHGCAHAHKVTLFHSIYAQFGRSYIQAILMKNVQQVKMLRYAEAVAAFMILQTMNNAISLFPPIFIARRAPCVEHIFQFAPLCAILGGRGGEAPIFFEQRASVWPAESRKTGKSA